MDLPEALTRLDNLENALLAQIQEVRTIRAEFQKQAVNGAPEPLLGAEQVAKILGSTLGTFTHRQEAGKSLP
jgi:hypothetical protein